MAVSQSETLQIYTALYLVREDWPGKLVLSLGLDDVGCAVAMAALAAGAAVLAIESQKANVKQAVQHGCCDFAVNTLDEALRILKNEVRQQRPVSVALLGDPELLLPTLTERGVSPNLLIVTHRAITAALASTAQRLAAQGVRIACWDKFSVGGWNVHLDLKRLLDQHYSEMGVADLPAVAALLRAQQIATVTNVLGSGERLARITQRWMEIVPRLFPRDRTVAVWQPKQD